MSERCNLPRPEVRGRTGFHPDQARLELAEKVEDGVAPKFLLQNDGTIRIYSVELENRLGQIDPECCNFHVVGSFLRWLSHSTNMAQCDAAGLEPSTPSEELCLRQGRGRTSVWL
jgi:hypothetical protein